MGYTHFDGLMSLGKKIADFGAAPTITQTTNRTYTADEVLKGLIVRDPTTTAVTDTLPTAALLLAALPGAKVGTNIFLLIKNLGTSTGVVTVAAGSGGTLSGTATVAAISTKLFRLEFTNVTNSPAYTIHSLLTSVH